MQFHLVVCSFMCVDEPKEELPSIAKIRAHCMQQLEQMRPDHMRRLNPTPYKVSDLFD